MENIVRVIVLVFYGLALGVCLGIAFALPANAKTVRVAVVDTGYSPEESIFPFFEFCSSGHFSFNPGDKDSPNKVAYGNNPHGTRVINTIAKEALGVDFCIIVINIGDAIALTSLDLKNAVVKASKANAHIINISMEGWSSFYLEKEAFIEAAKKSILVIAAGNSSIDLNKSCIAYPACYAKLHKNIIAVGGLDPTGFPARASNVGEFLYWGPFYTEFGRGTSFSAAWATGRLVKRLGEKINAK